MPIKINKLPKLSEKDIARFEAKVGPLVDSPNPDYDGKCRLWQASKNNNGYGKFGLNGTVAYAHRVAKFIEMGDDFDHDGWALHRCHVRACVNPECLYLGDRSDNTRDAIEAGNLKPPPRMRGSKNGKAKLTEQDVREIKTLLKIGTPQTAIARLYEVSPKTISHIKTGKNWSHVI